MKKMAPAVFLSSHFFLEILFAVDVMNRNADLVGSHQNLADLRCQVTNLREI